MLNPLDKLIVEFDIGLRTLLAQARSQRPHPDATIAEAELSEAEKSQASALMRVNHTGEVCAQALYSGQALTAHSQRTAAALKQAAVEETDHLAWTEQRLKELGSRTSLLNPLWYAGAFGLGLLAGRLGDPVSLGFVVETELQVGAHLQSHLQLLPEGDHASRAIVSQMHDDELRHADAAQKAGAVDLPLAVKELMRAAAKVMTTVAHHV